MANLLAWLVLLCGGGLRAVQKFVRSVSNRIHIKQALTVSVVTATFVHYAYRNLKPKSRFVPLVVARDKRDFYGSARYLERRNKTRHH